MFSNKLSYLVTCNSKGTSFEKNIQINQSNNLPIWLHTNSSPTYFCACGQSKAYTMQQTYK